MISYLFTNPLIFFIFLVALLCAIAIHEFAHAYVADRLGDPTPGLQGRLTLNPLAHIDLTGMIFLLFFGFGWGKPVMFDPFNLKNPRKDAAMISLAGPLSNFILALILSIVLRLFILFKLSYLTIIGSFLVAIIDLNIRLGVFNLLPIGPLDGFKIVGGIISQEQANQWYSLERYGLFFLLLLIIPLGQTSMLNIIVQPVYQFFMKLLLPTFAGSGII